jgi:hypothetical protein
MVIYGLPRRLDSANFPVIFCVARNRTAQTLIARLPYQETYDAAQFLKACRLVDLKGLICVSIPVVVENPMGAIEFIRELGQSGLTLIALVAWYRDRHVVVSKSRRLTSKWEPIAIFSRSPDYCMTKDAIRKFKRGLEGKVHNLDEDEFLCCQGDHWSVKNDPRDRRFLPATIVMNCGQLADLKPNDLVLDPFGNPAIAETCRALGWRYWDLNHPSNVRGVRKTFVQREPEDLEED